MKNHTIIFKRIFLLSVFIINIAYFVSLRKTPYINNGGRVGGIKGEIFFSSSYQVGSKLDTEFCKSDQGSESGSTTLPGVDGVEDLLVGQLLDLGVRLRGVLAPAAKQFQDTHFEAGHRHTIHYTAVWLGVLFDAKKNQLINWSEGILNKKCISCCQDCDTENN